MTFPFEQFISSVPNFPKEGILFKDITPLLADPAAFSACIKALEEEALKFKPTHIIGIESRGFIFGTPLAQMMNLPFLPARKPGKLPRPTHKVSYDLEYGTDELHIHKDDLPIGSRALIVDDLLATGGTATACGDLVRKADATVAGYLFVIELLDLKGAEKLKPNEHFSLVSY